MTGDAEGVRTLLARYCQYLDDSHFDEWTRLFTPDGLWVLGEREYRAGRTKNLRTFAREEGIALDEDEAIRR